MSSSQKSAALTRVRVWDAPVRLFHWLLVALLAFSWWSAEDGKMEWHRWSGYAVLALIVFRILWGVFGSETARFSHFMRGPRAIAAYAKGLTQKSRTASLGHNPLGGWSVLALIVLLLTQTTLGLFAVDIDGIESGPLSALVTFDQGRLAAAAHHFVFNAILALTALHLAAILFYALVVRDNLIGPMLSGNKAVGVAPARAPMMAPLWRAIVILALAASVAYAASKGFWLF